MMYFINRKSARLHDRTGRLEITCDYLIEKRMLHDRTGRLEKFFICFIVNTELHDRTGRLENLET